MELVGSRVVWASCSGPAESFEHFHGLVEWGLVVPWFLSRSVRQAGQQGVHDRVWRDERFPRFLGAR